MQDRSPLIRVINPNSNPEVTDGMSKGLEPLRRTGVRIECVTLSDGPFGIETDAHLAQVVPLLEAYIRADTDADAFVIACYSDPGLAQCRAVTARPVLGIQNAAVLSALTLGRRFGVIALSEGSIRRHLAYLETMGLRGALAGERPLDLSVAEAEAADAFDSVRQTGLALRDRDGADCLILGCAGMVRHRARLQAATGLPVVEPTWAATAAALGAVLQP